MVVVLLRLLASAVLPQCSVMIPVVGVGLVVVVVVGIVVVVGVVVVVVVGCCVVFV